MGSLEHLVRDYLELIAAVVGAVLTALSGAVGWLFSSMTHLHKRQAAQEEINERILQRLIELGEEHAVCRIERVAVERSLAAQDTKDTDRDAATLRDMSQTLGRVEGKVDTILSTMTTRRNNDNG